MRSITVKIIQFIFIMFPIVGCSTLSGEYYKMTLQQDAFLTSPGGEPEEVKKGDSVEVGKEPIYIESPGYVGMLVLPHQDSGELDINLKSIQNWGGAPFQKLSYQVLDSIVQNVIDFQIMVSKKKYQEALVTITDLKKKNPNIYYLSFLRASSLYLLNQTQASLDELKIGLTHFPNNPGGLALFKKITGRTFAKK